MVQIRTLVSSNEYCEFRNLVILLENSFAEITKTGVGIQQVHLAVTVDCLVTASYALKNENFDNISITESTSGFGSFELVNIIPLDCVHISVYSRRQHRIRICYCNGPVHYYELSERQNNRSIWRNWCDRIKFLNSDLLASSASDLTLDSEMSFPRSKKKTERRLAGGRVVCEKRVAEEKSEIEKATLSSGDPLMGVLSMLDFTDSNETADIGIATDQSVDDLLASLQFPKQPKPVNETPQPFPAKVSKVLPVPRFASGVSERCENRLTLGEYSRPLPTKTTSKKPTRTKSPPIVVLKLNPSLKSSSDTSFSTISSTSETRDVFGRSCTGLDGVRLRKQSTGDSSVSSLTSSTDESSWAQSSFPIASLSSAKHFDSPPKLRLVYRESSLSSEDSSVEDLFMDPPFITFMSDPQRHVMTAGLCSLPRNRRKGFDESVAVRGVFDEWLRCRSIQREEAVARKTEQGKVVLPCEENPLFIEPIPHPIVPACTSKMDRDFAACLRQITVQPCRSINLSALAEEALEIWTAGKKLTKNCEMIVPFPAVHARIVELQGPLLNRLRRVRSEVHLYHHLDGLTLTEPIIATKAILNCNVSERNLPKCSLHEKEGCWFNRTSTLPKIDLTQSAVSTDKTETLFWFLPLPLNFYGQDVWTAHCRYKAKMVQLKVLREFYENRCALRQSNILCVWVASSTSFLNPKSSSKSFYHRMRQSTWRSLGHFPNKAIAEQLTLIDARLLQRVDGNEVRHFVCSTYSIQDLAPHLKALVAWFDRVCNVIVTEVIDEPRFELRLQIVHKFLKVTENLLNMQNLNSSTAILYALQSLPLRETLNCLGEKKLQKFFQLCEELENKRMFSLQHVNELMSPYVVFTGDLISAISGQQPEEKLAKESEWLLPLVRIKGKQITRMRFEEETKNEWSFAVDWQRQPDHPEISSTSTISNQSTPRAENVKVEELCGSEATKPKILKVSIAPKYFNAILIHYKDACVGYNIKENSVIAKYLLLEPYRGPEKNFEFSKLCFKSEEKRH